jgi:dihydroorotate dehydrogenase electron transfer subunit
MYINKTQKGWKELASEVINTGKCVYCGACGAFCANVKFDAEKEVPIEDGSCEDVNTCRDGFGVCYNLCPKTELDNFPLRLLDEWVFEVKQDKILGHYLEILSIRLTDKAREELSNEAGPITGLLYTAITAEMIDAAILTGKDENFRPKPFIAESVKELLKGVGYKPSQGPTLSLIGEVINRNHTDIAVVGTPCQIQALRKLQNHPGFDFEAYDLITLTIGTFCTGTYYNQILNEIYKEKGIDNKEIVRINTDKDNFNLQIKTNISTLEIPLNYLYDKAIRKACFSCSDYTASFADISIGEFGSQRGWNTVIIRTKRGKKLVDYALEKGIIEAKPLDKEKEDLILEITRNKTDILKIEKIIEHSPEIKSFILRNGRIAKAYRPGMFVILWIPDYDFLPMSISNVEGNLIEITVQKIGEGTSKLFEMNIGEEIGIRGPFGNSFNYEDAKNILIVGGGMGIAALTSLISPLKRNKMNVLVTIGAKDDASLIFADRLMNLIPSTMCTTEDGSIGKKCLVTDTIEEIIKKENIDLIFTCGPEIMIKRVLEIADSKKIEIQASLERKMKCGVGLCGSCCIGENNNISVCKEGPVFNSAQLRGFPQFGTYKKESLD